MSGGGEEVAWDGGDGWGKRGCCFGGLVSFESKWRLVLNALHDQELRELPDEGGLKKLAHLD